MFNILIYIMYLLYLRHEDNNVSTPEKKNYLVPVDVAK